MIARALTHDREARLWSEGAHTRDDLLDQVADGLTVRGVVHVSDEQQRVVSARPVERRHRFEPEGDAFEHAGTACLDDDPTIALGEDDHRVDTLPRTTIEPFPRPAVERTVESPAAAGRGGLRA